MTMVMMSIRITIVRCDHDDNDHDDDNAAEDNVKEIMMLTSKKDCDHIPDQIGVRKRQFSQDHSDDINNNDGINIDQLSGYKDYFKEIIIIIIKMTVVTARIEEVKDQRITIIIGQIKETKYDIMTVFIAHISEIKDDSGYSSDQRNQ